MSDFDSIRADAEEEIREEKAIYKEYLADSEDYPERPYD